MLGIIAGNNKGVIRKCWTTDGKVQSKVGGGSGDEKCCAGGICGFLDVNASIEEVSTGEHIYAVGPSDRFVRRNYWLCGSKYAD